MNYGLGGNIFTHKDTNSATLNKTGSSENTSYGGQRIVTFMMYLSNLELGGKHNFPQY